MPIQFEFCNNAALKRAINADIEHYNLERPHQGIGNVAIEKNE